MVNIRKIISFLLTLIIILGINYGITILFKVGFIDYSFVVGLISIVVIYFFNSSGGFFSKNIDMQIQGQTGIRMEQKEEKKFYPSIAFFTAILYTVVSVIALLYTYKDYF